MDMPQTQHPITPAVRSVAALLRNTPRPTDRTRLLLWEAANESDEAFVDAFLLAVQDISCARDAVEFAEHSRDLLYNAKPRKDATGGMLEYVESLGYNKSAGVLLLCDVGSGVHKYMTQSEKLGVCIDTFQEELGAVMLAANLRHNGLDLGYCVGEAIERFVPLLYAASLITLGAQERRDGDVWAVVRQIEELPRVGAQVASGLVGEGLSYEDLLHVARVSGNA
jgi:hypothetical protein